MCGTTRPTKPISPLTATAAAVASEAARMTSSRSRPGCTPERGAPRRPRPRARRAAAAAEQQHEARRHEVGQDEHDVGPLRAAELAEQPAVDLAQVVGVLLLDEGLAGGEEGGDGDAGQQQGGAVRAARRACPSGERAADADQGADEGGQRHDAERARAYCDGE